MAISKSYWSAVSKDSENHHSLVCICNWTKLFPGNDFFTAQNLLKIFLNCKFNVNLVPLDGVKDFSTYRGAFFGIEKNRSLILLRLT